MNGEAPQEVIVHTRWWPPSWLVVTGFAAILLVTLGGGFTWYEIDGARDDARIRCERAVLVREETRSMWLMLFEAYPAEADSTGLREELERVLPPLTCDGTIPTSPNSSEPTSVTTTTEGEYP